MRLTIFRCTAFGKVLLLTTNPSLGDLRPLGLASTRKYLPFTQHLKWKTDENSSVFNKRRLLGKARKAVTPSKLYGQAGAALCTACANDGPATASFHPNQKTVGTLSPNHGRLICTFHDILTSWRIISDFGKPVIRPLISSFCQWLFILFSCG